MRSRVRVGVVVEFVVGDVDTHPIGRQKHLDRSANKLDAHIIWRFMRRVSGGMYAMCVIVCVCVCMFGLIYRSGI